MMTAALTGFCIGVFVYMVCAFLGACEEERLDKERKLKEYGRQT
jgi:hypothetical protein